MKIDIGEITRSFAPRINHNYVRKYFRIDRETNINDNGFDTFDYNDSRENRKKYFPHIQWEEIKVLKWK